MIGIVVGVMLLAALIITVLVLIYITRRIHKKRKLASEPIYETIDALPEITSAFVTIKVVPNESYAALGPPGNSSLAPTYGSTIRRGIIESFRNLAIDLHLSQGR